jgi:hypothetical protein
VSGTTLTDEKLGSWGRLLTQTRTAVRDKMQIIEMSVPAIRDVLGLSGPNTVPVDRSAGKLPFVAHSFSVATGIAMGWDEEDPLAGVEVSSRSPETTSVVARNLYPRLGRVSI